MALAVANSWQSVGGSTFTKAVTVSGFVAGDLCVVGGFAFNNSPGDTLAAVTDDGGNSYTERSQTTHDATFRSWAQISETVVVTPPTSVSINMTSGNAELTICVLRITGASASPFDVAATPRTLTADDPSSNSLTTAQADEILVAGITQDSAGSYSNPASFTIQQKAESSGFTDFAVATRIVSSTGSYAAAWVTGGSADYGLVLAAYKAAAAGVDTGLAWIRA